MKTVKCTFWLFAALLAVAIVPFKSTYGAPSVGVGAYSAQLPESGVVRANCYYGGCGYYPRYRGYYGGYYRPYRRHYYGYRPYRPYRYGGYYYRRPYYRHYRRYW